MQAVVPDAFTRAGILAGSIVRLSEEEELLVFVSKSRSVGVHARLMAIVRPMLGEDLNIRQPSARSSRYATEPLRLTLVPGQTEGFGHPKGFYETPNTMIPGYTAWRDGVTAALRKDHPGAVAVYEHPDFGVLWQRDLLRTYTNRGYPGYCVRCGASRPGSLVNPDHAHCENCLPPRRPSKRFCRCCRQLFNGHGVTIFGSCHDWLRAFRRNF